MIPKLSLSQWGNLVLLSLCLILLLDHCLKGNQISRLTQEKNFLSDTMKTYKDKEGLNHSSIRVSTLSQSDLNQLQPGLLKEISRKTTVKPSGIKSYINAASETTQELRTYTIIHDTVYAGNDFAPSFKYHDKWIDIEGELLEDTVNLKYTIRDSLWFVTYWKHSGLFNKNLLIDGYSSDPNTKLTGIKAISLDKENNPVRLSLGPVLSMSLQNGQVKPTLGFGIQYNLIRF